MFEGEPMTNCAEGQKSARRSQTLVAWLLLVVWVALLVRTAWLCDDAYITLRTVDNFVHGYGLTWNVNERVQAYTHPLWMFVLAFFYFFTREAFFTLHIVSIGVSCAALLWAAKTARSPWTLLLGGSLLLLSKAFVDYSTSGLENPLTHLLIALFLWVYLRAETFDPKTLSKLALFAALGMLTRLDLLLIFAPALIYAGLKTKSWRGWLALGAGFLPLVLWEAFSIVYYGFALPNTYYAKLNTGIPHDELIKQGLIYLLNSLNWDPLTLTGIAFALLATVKRRVTRDWIAALGILLYVAYVVWVGGDFMSGRFLTAPLFFAVILLGQSEFMENLSVKYLPFALIFLVGLLSPFPTLISDGAYGLSGDAFAGNQGVGDERGVYYQATSLLTLARDVQMPNHPWAVEGRNRRTDGPRVFSRGAIGFIGFYAGPSVHIVDDNALADPLLARLPVVKQPWRIGHFRRVFPEGYLASLERGEALIADPNLARFYDQLTLITRGSLFAPGRWEAIWKMNTGQYERLIDKAFYSYYASRLPLQEMSAIKEGAVQWDEVFTLNAGGLLIALPGAQHAPYVEVSLYHTDAVALFYYEGSDLIAQQSIPPAPLQPEYLNRYCVAVPEAAVSAGYDQIGVTILSQGWDFTDAVGHLRLCEETLCKP